MKILMILIMFIAMNGSVMADTYGVHSPIANAVYWIQVASGIRDNTFPGNFVESKTKTVTFTHNGWHGFLPVVPENQRILITSIGAEYNFYALKIAFLHEWDPFLMVDFTSGVNNLFYWIEPGQVWVGQTDGVFPPETLEVTFTYEIYEFPGEQP